MKTKRTMVTVVAVAAILAMTLTGEAIARGGNGKGGGGSLSAPAGSATTRPADSQRRDGTFLTTGTTASGAATRPDRGNGLRDGSRLGLPAAAPAAPVTAQ